MIAALRAVAAGRAVGLRPRCGARGLRRCRCAAPATRRPLRSSISARLRLGLHGFLARVRARRRASALASVSTGIGAVEIRAGRARRASRRAARAARASGPPRPRLPADRRAGTARRRRGSAGSPRRPRCSSTLRTSRFLPSRMANMSQTLAPCSRSSVRLDRAVVDAVDRRRRLAARRAAPASPGHGRARGSGAASRSRAVRARAPARRHWSAAAGLRC